MCVTLLFAMASIAWGDNASMEKNMQAYTFKPFTGEAYDNVSGLTISANEFALIVGE